MSCIKPSDFPCPQACPGRGPARARSARRRPPRRGATRLAARQGRPALFLTRSLATSGAPIDPACPADDGRGRTGRSDGTGGRGCLPTWASHLDSASGIVASSAPREQKWRAPSPVSGRIARVVPGHPLSMVSKFCGSWARPPPMCLRNARERARAIVARAATPAMSPAAGGAGSRKGSMSRLAIVATRRARRRRGRAVFGNRAGHPVHQQPVIGRRDPEDARYPRA